MNPTKYTRCPQCRTVFRIKPAQLEARAGLVRCGSCAVAFQADQHLFDAMPDDAATQEIARTDDARDDVSDGGGGAWAGRSGLLPSRGATSLYVGTAGPLEGSPATMPEDGLPLMDDLPFGRPRRRVPTALWYLGAVLSLAVLAGQVAYFYAPQLARDARLQPWLAHYCERLGCAVQPPPGKLPIDLAETAVEPHPQYQNALRLHAVLVNRAERARPWPLMEVSLTDSEGKLLARRHFTAAQYLESPSSGGAPPGVAVRTQVDVIHADGRAVGYEIRLVAAPE
jgi:predicted Zn finger-like uncharacterized protein